MSVNNYLNLYLDAGISDQHDQESYSRRLDAVLAQESITVDDIVGLGENGTGSNFDLYVVHRHAITLACEKGLFNKRIEVRRLCPIASIARLRGDQEGYKGREITIAAHDAEGKVLTKIVWGLSGPDWVEPLVLRQREQLFKVISEAMDRIGEASPAATAKGDRSTHPLLPPNIVSIMERSGRHKIAPHSSGEPSPLDPGWEPIIPFDVEEKARAEPQAYVDALAEVIVPVSGWAVYGAAELALDVMHHDLDNSSYRALFVEGLDVRRKAEVPWVMLNSFDHAYWSEAHPDEPWLPERLAPAREAAKITPLKLHEERCVAQVSPGNDSKLMFITRPAPDLYVMMIEHPQDDGSRVRGEMYKGSTLYDVYAGIGQRVIAHFWNDPEFEPFCKYVAPKL